MAHDTVWFISAFVLIAIIYDIIALIRGGPSATISSVLLKYSKLYPVIPFAIGVLMGHLFFSQ